LVKLADLLLLCKKPQCHPAEHEFFLRSILGTVGRGIPGVFVEIGTNKGKSLACLLQALNALGQRRQVYCVDPFENAAKFFPTRVARFAGEIPCRHIRLPSQRRDAGIIVTEPIAWLFIDGCHCYDCVLGDIDQWVPKVITGGTVVFHDFCPRFNYSKRDYCEVVKAKRRWGVWPAFKTSQNVQSLEKIEQSSRRTPGMAIFRKV